MNLIRKKPLNIVLLTILSIALACGYFFGGMMFTPSLPAITHYFNTDSSLARMTVSSFLIVMSISQLVYGPASDKYGRKPVILAGSLIFAIGSVLCLLSSSIDSLIFGRAIQGLGAGALITLARTIIQDSLPKEQFLKAIAWMSIFFSMAPAISPLIGGFLELNFGWHSSFILMFCFAIILIVLVIFLLPETNKEKNHKALNIKHLSTNYLTVAKNKMFWTYLLFIISALSGGITFDVIGSFVLINDYHLSAASFGIVSTSLMLMMVLARFLMSLLLLGNIKKESIILLGLFIMLITSTSLLTLDILNLISLSSLIIILAFFCLGSGLLIPISAASALGLFDKIKGAAGAFYGSMQMGGAFLISLVASSIEPSIGFMLSILCFMSIISFFVGIKTFYKKNQFSYSLASS